MLPGFVSVPWDPFPSEKIELWVGPTEGQKDMGKDLQCRFPKENPPLYLRGTEWQIGQGLRCKEHLCFLYFLSFRSCCFTIHKAFQLAFLIWFSITSCMVTVHTIDVGCGEHSNFTNRIMEIVQGQMLREKVKTHDSQLQPSSPDSCLFWSKCL